MTKLEVIILPSQLDDVRDALTHPWITGMTVTEVKGFGVDQGRGVCRGADLAMDGVSSLRVEVVVPQALAPRLLWDLEQALRGSRVGGGRIFVSPVDEAVRVRTAERGESAL